MWTTLSTTSRIQAISGVYSYSHYQTVWVLHCGWPEYHTSTHTGGRPARRTAQAYQCPAAAGCKHRSDTHCSDG